eukprot:4293699-Alexandrium_andersonii.AAC.1
MQWLLSPVAQKACFSVDWHVVRTITSAQRMCAAIVKDGCPDKDILAFSRLGNNGQHEGNIE